MERVHAARAVIGDRQGPRAEGMKNVAGAAIFGDGRLDKLVACRLYGALGEVGDRCGRAPADHKLEV